MDQTATMARPPGPRTRPGPIGFRISATAVHGIDWRLLDETWALAGEQDVFDAGWTSDHLSFAGQERGGPSFESLTALAALAHRVPGKWVGVAVISNTFRHPSVLAKSATVLDNVTGGRFILGIGSGWHAGEHDAFGIPLPPPPVLFDRLEGSLRVLRALFSDEARSEPGVTLDDPFVSLHEATNLPPPIRGRGPMLWLGVEKRRGRALIAEFAEGWVMRGDRPGDVPYFRETRDLICRSLEDAGRDIATFDFAAQVSVGATADSRPAALDASRDMIRAGATHVILGVPATSAPGGLLDMAREVAEPLREFARRQG
jgi:alkanesulfonate monooxygenase SsuD/methylene tetrahydromethanopterin reductase-like flavin-dependent oxidoreductase (luciferase family)